MILIGCAFKAELAALRIHLFGRTANPIEPLDGGLIGYRGPFGTDDVILLMTGIGMRKARDATLAALERWPEPEFILSTGVAGALDPALIVGAIVLADRVMICDPETGMPEHMLDVTRERRVALLGALRNAGKAVADGVILTSRKPLSRIADKRRAAELCGAVAVDMESAAIALAASARGVPYVCLRTILDLAGEDLIGAELADENGRVRLLAAIGAVTRNPSVLVAGVRLLRNLRIATDAMGEAVAAALSQSN
jgi:adenosylhomocysteine nucleosidase